MIERKTALCYDNNSLKLTDYIEKECAYDRKRMYQRPQKYPPF